MLWERRHRSSSGAEWRLERLAIVIGIMRSGENRGASKGQERKLCGIRLGEILCLCVGLRLVSLVSESERFLLSVSRLWGFRR